MSSNTGTAVGYSSARINTQTTTTLSTKGPGILHSVILNTPASGTTITIYDGNASTGRVIAFITLPEANQVRSLVYDAEYLNGLTVVTAVANSDITVTFI